MNSKKIIITGYNGLIGSAIANLFHANGYEVLGMGRTGTHTSFKTINLDLSNWDAVSKFDFKETYTIVHCAALIPSKNISSDECYKINSEIDNNIYKILLKNAHIDLIFISTTNFYIFDGNIIDENSVILCTNSYATSKFNTEKLLLTLKNKIHILRVNAAYNSKMKANTVLKIFVNNALQNIDIVYHGTGKRSQDFIHVKDIALAALACLNKKSGDVYNIASGKSISMKSLAELIIGKLPNCLSKIKTSGEDDLQENYKANFSIQKAKNKLNWNPTISLESGLEDWIKELEK